MQQQYEEPLVSVCCLTYNHKNTIAQALDSILAQRTSFPVEIIVHDDASTDGTTDIVREYANKFPNVIHPILQEENQYKRCNLAKEFVNPVMKGRYVAICEGDDYWTDPYKLQYQIEYMKAHPDCTMCFHAIRQLDSDGRMKIFHPQKRSGIVPIEEVINSYLGGNFCPTVSLVFRRDVLECWPKFRLTAKYIYDFPAQVLAATMGQVYYMDRVMAVYRFEGEGSWSEKQKGIVNYDHLEMTIKWMDEFDQYTGYAYHKSVKRFLARFLIARYKRTLQPRTWQMAREQIQSLGILDKCHYYGLYLLFRFGGERFQKFWFKTKEIIKRDQV